MEYRVQGEFSLLFYTVSVSTTDGIQTMHGLEPNQTRSTKPRARQEKLASGIALLALSALLFTGTPPVLAGENQEAARRLREIGEILPLETIMDKARGYRNGDVIEIELEREDWGYKYEFEILDSSGQVWELELNATTGELIELKRDD
ncbi:MAG: PepSY domain-containing protein [Burkholderiales bacterium]